jgi:hypothetical protein
MLMVLTGSARIALAHGSDVPHHKMRGVECVALGFINQLLLRAFPPQAMFSWYNVDFREVEQVQWRPVLYRLDEQTNQWIPQKEGARVTAFTSRYGFQQPGWRSDSTGGQLQFFPFYVAPGIYTVLHQIYWNASGVSHHEWAPNSCRIGS